MKISEVPALSVLLPLERSSWARANSASSHFRSRLRNGLNATLNAWRQPIPYHASPVSVESGHSNPCLAPPAPPELDLTMPLRGRIWVLGLLRSLLYLRLWFLLSWVATFVLFCCGLLQSLVKLHQRLESLFPDRPAPLVPELGRLPQDKGCHVVELAADRVKTNPV